MAEKTETKPKKDATQWGKVLLTGVFVVSFMVIVVAIARLTPITKRFYTDADSIRVPAQAAKTRDILWQPARSLSELVNTSADDYEPRLSADGLTLYFVRGKAGGNADIYTSTRTTDGWSEPTPLADVNSTYDDLGPEPSRDGKSLYFYSDRPGGSGGYDIWVAHRGLDGWQEAINLGPSVNSEFNDYGPALAPMGEALYFASNRPEPIAEPGSDQPDPNAWPATLREDLYQRDYDLYMSALVDGAVGTAQRLDKLCTPYNDGAPAVSSFGDFLYFSSDRPGGQGAFDLYRSRRLRGQHESPINLGPSVNTPANELDPGLSLGGYALYFSSDRLTDASKPDQPRAYDLYYTTSREVFSEVEQTERPPINWAALWSEIGPNLLWALLALLLLLLLLALLRDMRGRRMSLLAKCLLASITAHLLMLLLFNVWEVTASLAKEFHRRGRIQIALASPTVGTEVFTQIRGDLTAVEKPEVKEVQTQRQESVLPMETKEALTQMAVQRHRFEIDDRPDAAPQAEDAIVRHENEAPDEKLDQPDLQPVTLDTAVPTESHQIKATETDVAETAEARELQPQHEADLDISASLNQESSIAELTPTQTNPSDAALRADRTSFVTPSQPNESVPDETAAPGETTPDVHSLTIPSVADLTLPKSAERQMAQASETNPSVAVRTVSAPRRDMDITVPVESAGAVLQQLNPQSGTTATDESSFVDQPTANAIDPTPATTTAAVQPSTAMSLPPALPQTDIALAAPPTGSRQSADEASFDEPTPAESTVRRTLNAQETRVDADTRPAELNPEQAEHPNLDTSLAATKTDATPDTMPTRVTPDASIGSSATTDMPAQPSLALSTLEQASPDAVKEEQESEVSTTDTESPRAELDTAIKLADATPVENLLNPEERRIDLDEDSRTLADLAVPKDRDTPDRPPSYPGLVPLPNVALSPSALSLDLELPTESKPPDNPYVQRTADNRLAIVERMGGSEDTEKAVADALKWLAAHQSEDGHWDGEDFDKGCGQCGGETDVLSDHAQTGLALLAFLGSGHTHKKEGPYRRVVEKGVRWLANQQKPDGDLRGDETMYSHGIASIAMSEAFGMTRDSELRSVVQKAVNFIDRARNRDEGGWRYDPGQPGDTSVLGWQVMALKSAAMNGVATPAESFNAARQWLDKVSKPSSRGLYAYKPNREYSPAMTAEGMFTQVLLGRSRDDARMQQSVKYLSENLPDWDDETNTYYWYYGTLAMYQDQGPHWRDWNAAVTAELLKHQRHDGAAAGSWDPDGEWADKGGRVYQTALGALILEVYYRYLPLYSVEQPEDAIGGISGTVKNTATGQPLPGAEVRLVLPDREPVSVMSGPDGRYKLFVPEVPDFFALSASREGFLPQTHNVDAAMLHGTTLEMDFDLKPSSEELVAIEPVPDVHHLGDNAFSGSINSQFQKESEGDRYAEDFELTERQIAPYYTRAEVHLLAKGVQRRHRIVINGETLDKRLEEAPEDGSFGEFTARFDASILRAGTNTLEVIAKPSSSDIDDFEFVNIQIRLMP